MCTVPSVVRHWHRTWLFALRAEPPREESRGRVRRSRRLPWGRLRLTREASFQRRRRLTPDSGCASLPISLTVVIPLIFLTGLAAHLEALPRHSGQRLDPAAMAAIISMVSLLVIASVLIQWLYYAYLESGEKQATWGKQALGLYVTDVAGQRISFGRASGRFFAKIVTGMIPLGLGYIMAGFTEKQQALHDMIASCLVLRR